MRCAAAFALLAAVSLTTGCRGPEPEKATAPVATEAAQAQAPAGTSGSETFTGTVAETMNSGGYTYARLQAAGKDDVWIAAPEFPAKKGDRLTVALTMPMRDFESQTLKRKFPVIYFVSDVTAGGQAGTASTGARAGAVPALMTSHAPAAAAAPAAARVEVKPVAPPPGGLSIADVWAKRTSLAGQEVTVRGTVVKVNEQILGRNWIHLQDGSGSADAHTNDLTVTTGEIVKVGDVITVKGVLAVDKDFGAGYSYQAILEDSKLVQ